MNKTSNLNKVADDAKNQVAAAIDTVKARAAATADEIGRATRKTIHDAQGATEEAWSDAASRAKDLQYQIEVYLREQRANTIIMAVAAGLLISLILLLLRMNRK